MTSKKNSQVIQEKCVACGACTKQCPLNAISVIKGCYAQVDIQICVGCGKCTVICPANAIILKERVKP